MIKPLLLNKLRGMPRVHDRCVLNGIFWALRSGAPWRGLPKRYGPRTIVFANKACDANRSQELIQDQGATPNIPPKSNER